MFICLISKWILTAIVIFADVAVRLLLDSLKLLPNSNDIIILADVDIPNFCLTE